MTIADTLFDAVAEIEAYLGEETKCLKRDDYIEYDEPDLLEIRRVLAEMKALRDRLDGPHAALKERMKLWG